MKMFTSKKKHEELSEETSQEDVLNTVDNSTKSTEEDSDLSVVAEASIDPDEIVNDTSDVDDENLEATEESESLNTLSNEELDTLVDNSIDSDDNVSDEEAFEDPDKRNYFTHDDFAPVDEYDEETEVDLDADSDVDFDPDEVPDIVTPVDKSIIDQDTIDLAVQHLVDEKGPKSPSNKSESELIKENMYLQTQILSWSEAYSDALSQIQSWQAYADQLSASLRQRDIDTQSDIVNLKKRHAEALSAVRQSVEDEYHDRKATLDNIVKNLQKISMPGEEV